MNTMNNSERKKVVIIGAGFGGLSVAKSLRKAPVDVVVVDRRNHHLFQPLLYQVATAELSPATIAAPVRNVLRAQANATVYMAEVTAIDAARRLVIARDGVESIEIPYDALVVATGARHSYFGHDEWERFAPGLKSIEDATRLRANILMAFERAEATLDPLERAAQMTFAIVGGGPTGVELAGAIAEVAHRVLKRDFRHVQPSHAKVLLIEALPRILTSFPDDLAARAQRDLERLGVTVRTGAKVEDVRADGLVVNGSLIRSRTVIWAAGVKASPAAEWLGVESDRAGRVKVQADFSVAGRPEVFVIGDTALALGADGKPLPGVAPAAMQAGQYVGRLIARRAAGGADPAPFRYVNKGNLATIGRASAIADFGKFHLTGFLAWLLWGAVHILFLIDFRNRLRVMTEWVWAYLSSERGARLITDSSGAGVAAAARAPETGIMSPQEVERHVSRSDS